MDSATFASQNGESRYTVFSLTKPMLCAILFTAITKNLLNNLVTLILFHGAVVKQDTFLSGGLISASSVV